MCQNHQGFADACVMRLMSLCGQLLALLFWTPSRPSLTFCTSLQKSTLAGRTCSCKVEYTCHAGITCCQPGANNCPPSPTLTCHSVHRSPFCKLAGSEYDAFVLTSAPDCIGPLQSTAKRNPRLTSASDSHPRSDCARSIFGLYWPAKQRQPASSTRNPIGRVHALQLLWRVLLPVTHSSSLKIFA